MNARGISLLELLTVIAVVAILLTIATLDFRSWTLKFRIERQTREMYSEIMHLRLSSLQRKQPQSIAFGPKQFVVRSFANETDTIGTVTASQNLDCEIRRRTDAGPVAFNINTDSILFDSRGFTNDFTTIVITPLQFDAVDNCIKVHAGRTNIGRMIDAKTCVSR